MPARTRRGRKRAAEILTEEEPQNDENSSQGNKAAPTFDPTYVEEELQDLRQQVEQRCAEIMEAAREMQQRMTVLHHSVVVRIPKRVKTMSVKNFQEEFGPLPGQGTSAPDRPPEASENTVLRTAIKAAPGAKHNVLATPKPGAARGVLQTPAGRGLPMQTPGGGRAPRIGETFMSANGSPIQVCPASVTVTAKKGRREVAPTIELNVLGDVVKLGSPSAKDKVKNNPVMQEKLLEMQNEISQLLGQINVKLPAAGK